MTWERFFLLVLVAAPIFVASWLLWAVLPSGLAYVLAIIVSAVVAWHGRPMHDEALKDSAIRSGRWPI